MPTIRSYSRQGERPDRQMHHTITWSLPPDPVTGERKRESQTFHGTLSDAKKYAAKHQAEIDQHGKAYHKPDATPLADYLKSWLARKASEVEDTTWATYESLLRVHVYPSAIGNVPLADLTPKAIQDWVDAMCAGTGPEGKVLSARTAGYTRTILHDALEDAVRLERIPANPVAKTKGPKQVKTRKVEAFELNDLDTLLDRAKSTRLEPLFRFMAFSGLRRGEALGLRWEDVDLETGVIMIRRARVAVSGKAKMHDKTKTKAGMRTLSLSEPALEALLAQRVQIEKDRLDNADWCDEGWVFTKEDGGPLGPNNVSRDFRRIRRTLDIPDLPLHAERHTAVSVEIAAGVPIEIISKRIGHKNISVTMDTYGHLLPEADKAAADAVTEFLRKRKKDAQG